MATPIFIVGTPRSGTTWLSNTLGRHSRIACVQESISDKRGGVNESAFFSYVAGKFGNLKNDNNLIQLIEVFSSSTFFILSGIDKTIFYKKRPQTYSEFFRLFMDHFADKQGSDFWLEKTPSHTFHLKEISRYYKDAKFVAVRRNVVDQIKSFIKINEIISGVKTKDLPFSKKKAEILVRLYKYHAHTKHFEHFIAKNPDKIWQIDYEDLTKSTEQAIRKLCGFLKIDFEGDMLHGYIPNTSFESDDDRGKVLSMAEVIGIKILSPLMKLLPYGVHRLMYLTKRTLGGRNFPYWFFSYNIEKHGWSNVFGKGHERVKYDPED
jgi:hypothetical protein